MFWQHYLGNKKPTFLALNPKQVYAAILESSKNNELFRKRQNRSLLDRVSRGRSNVL